MKGYVKPVIYKEDASAYEKEIKKVIEEQKKEMAGNKKRVPKA